MGVAITFLLTAAIIALVAFGFGSDLLTAFDEVTDSWTLLQDRSKHRADTTVDARAGQSTQRQPTVRLTLVNSGKTALAQFKDWDVIVELQRADADGLEILYLTYTDSNPPGCNQWTVDAIYHDAAAADPETAGPGILNPGEELVILLNPQPPLEVNTYDRATFATPEGITAEVVFEVVPPQTTTLYVVDSADALVYQYGEAGTFLGTSALHALNGDAVGITTDVTDFWTTDVIDDELYRYASSFSFVSTSTLAVANNQGAGLTTDGCNIWAVDHTGAQKVHKYNMSGSFVSDFLLTAANDNATGITTDGRNIWVVDHKDDKAYKYDMAGSPVSDFPLDTDQSNARGIATNGTNIWVVDQNTKKVYKYDMSGVFLSDFELTGANGDPQGLTVSPR